MFSDGNCSSYAASIIRNKLLHDNGSITTDFLSYMQPQFVVDHLTNHTTDACTSLIIVPVKPLEVFPWWILWLICALALLFLILWLLWLCCPRCCASVCWGDFKTSPMCNVWCTASGYYSSFSHKGLTRGMTPGMDVYPQFCL